MLESSLNKVADLQETPTHLFSSEIYEIFWNSYLKNIVNDCF